MSVIDDLIKRLPDEFQELAQRYMPILVNMTFDELEQWVGLLAEGNWQKAYQNVVVKMSIDESVAEQKRINELLQKLNEENADKLAMDKDIVRQILLIALFMLRSEIE